MTLQETFRKVEGKKYACEAPDSGVGRTFVILSLALGPLYRQASDFVSTALYHSN